MDSDDELYASDTSFAEEDGVILYLREKRAAKKVEVIDHYKGNKNRYPIIYDMTEDYLATSAISSPSDSFFSHVNVIITRKRTRLLPETIKSLAMLKTRGPIEDEETTINDNIGEYTTEKGKENEILLSISNRGINIDDNKDDSLFVI